MSPTVGDVMREVRNYFQELGMQRAWTVTGGVLAPGEGLQAGDWVAVTGSRRCNGVYQLQEGLRLADCPDDRFDGVVWLLTPPPAFLALCEEIAAWCRTAGDGSLRRESFGGYSREMATDDQGMPLTWQKRFAAQLTPYRRMLAGVRFWC